MKSFNSVVLLCIAVIVCSCKKQPNYYEKGLCNLKNHRVVEEKFIDAIKVDKVGVIKTNSDSIFNLVLLINRKTDTALINKYNLGIRCYLNKENSAFNNNKRKKHFSFPFSIEKVNNYKYFTANLNTRIRKIDTLELFLMKKNDSRGKNIGRSILLKNIKIK